MRAISRIVFFLGLAALCATCGGDGGNNAQQAQRQPPEPPVVTVDAGLKQLVFSWAAVPDATHYKLLENPDGHSGFTQVGADLVGRALSATLPIAVHLHDWVNALYIVQACNSAGCAASLEVSVADLMLDTVGYFKASNTDGLDPDNPDDFDGDRFGRAVALSADGMTLAVGAPCEESSAIGVNGDQDDNAALCAGAVYLFRFDGSNWVQEAYLKASDAIIYAFFGQSVALGDDGNTLAVGSGRRAVYIFEYDGTEWGQTERISKPLVTCAGFGGDGFGDTVALSADGRALAVSAVSEVLDPNVPFCADAGAVYVYRFDGQVWSQEAHLVASNAARQDRFGSSLALDADGNTLAVGARWEDSAATGIDGDQDDNSATEAGAVYVFRFDGAEWSQDAYLKASNAELTDYFGAAVALSADGSALSVGAWGEDSLSTGINGDQYNDSGARPFSQGSGAVYLFRHDGTNWLQDVYFKASNTGTSDSFGHSVVLSADGDAMAVAALREASSATGIDGDQNDDAAWGAGAVYVFRFDGAGWYQAAFVKASNTDGRDQFGYSVAMNATGSTLAVGAPYEQSNATGIDGEQTDNTAVEAGAVYVY